MRRSAIEHIEAKYLRSKVPEFTTGDTVRVHWKVKEGEKERVQPFEGVVIRKTKGALRATFTVRKVSYGIGVERIFPLHSPRYEKIDVLTRGDVNRSRLFYLRDLKGKASRVDVLDDREKVETPAQSAAGTPAKAGGKKAKKADAPAQSA